VAGAVAGDALAVGKFLAAKDNDRERIVTDADVDAVNTMLKERLGNGHDCSKLTMGTTLLQVRALGAVSCSVRLGLMAQMHVTWTRSQRAKHLQHDAPRGHTLPDTGVLHMYAQVAAAHEQWSILAVIDAPEATAAASSSGGESAGGAGVTGGVDVSADPYLAACMAAASGDVAVVRAYLSIDSQRAAFKPSLEIEDATPATTEKPRETAVLSNQRKSRTLTVSERNALLAAANCARVSAGVPAPASAETDASAKSAGAPATAIDTPNEHAAGAPGAADSTAAPKDCTCGICFDEFAQGEMTGLRCNHFFCKACYRATLLAKTREGVSMVQCPFVSANGQVCVHVVDDATAASLLTPSEMRDYKVACRHGF